MFPVYGNYSRPSLLLKVLVINQRKFVFKEFSCQKKLDVGESWLTQKGCYQRCWLLEETLEGMSTEVVAGYSI